jgi:type IV pilus assembly protein PilW
MNARSQQGMSLVELMVGVTVGLFVVAAASLLMTTQLSENRRLLLEAQLQQDLRATSDIITRELRRSGFSAAAERSVANASGSFPPSDNTYLDVTINPAGPAGRVDYNYKRPDNAPGAFGYKLESGILKTNLPGAGWQELTDKSILAIDSFWIDLDSATPIVLACPKDCPAPIPSGKGADYCWPTLTVRTLTVTIRGHSVIDAAVVRTVRSVVRLRNDQLAFRAQDPGTASPQACPA